MCINALHSKDHKILAISCFAKNVQAKVTYLNILGVAVLPVHKGQSYWKISHYIALNYAELVC